MADGKKTGEQPTGIDVAYVAHLARLHLTAAEREHFQAQLAQVVAYVQQIRDLNVEGIEPTTYAHPVTNVFRADEPRPGLSTAVVLANAPARIDDQFQVPKIVE